MAFLFVSSYTYTHTHTRTYLCASVRVCVPLSLCPPLRRLYSSFFFGFRFFFGRGGGVLKRSGRVPVYHISFLPLLLSFALVCFSPSPLSLFFFLPDGVNYPPPPPLSLSCAVSLRVCARFFLSLYFALCNVAVADVRHQCAALHVCDCMRGAKRRRWILLFLARIYIIFTSHFHRPLSSGAASLPCSQD